MKYKCLSIAGFDGSGGAGIQADLKTFSALGCYGITVLTALPVQNTCGVKKCYDIPVQSIEEQLQTIFEDIMPDSIKIGMLFSSEIIDIIANFIKIHAKDIPIVLDPVMIAKGGDPLLLPNAINTMKQKLIPLTTILTPNLPEAYTLVGQDDDVEQLAKRLLQLGATAILVKGGHSQGNESNDLFYSETVKKMLRSARIKTNNTHGTGCTLSAAIAAFLAQGYSNLEACCLAKDYLYDCILAAKNTSVGRGNGPVNHFCRWWKG